MKKTAGLVLAMVLVFAFGGCRSGNDKPKETAQQENIMETTVVEAPMEGNIPEGMPPGMGQSGEMPGGMPPGMGQGPATERETVVPDSVRKKWVASKILVTKKSDEGEGTVFEMSEGESVQIPGSSLRVTVGHYLPDFSMGPGMITSKSDEPNQPTVKLTVYEEEKEIYSGWAFEKIPEAHAFFHPEYSVTLVGGVEAE